MDQLISIAIEVCAVRQSIVRSRAGSVEQDAYNWSLLIYLVICVDVSLA